MTLTAPASFEFARDTTRQILTISSVIIGGTVTFAEGILDSSSRLQMFFLVGAWTAFLLTVFFCICTLQALTGSLAESEDPTSSAQLSVYNDNIRRPAICQLVVFLVALAFTVALGVSSVL